jgi:hypothetical protein
MLHPHCLNRLWTAHEKLASPRIFAGLHNPSGYQPPRHATLLLGAPGVCAGRLAPLSGTEVRSIAEELQHCFLPLLVAPLPPQLHQRARVVVHIWVFLHGQCHRDICHRLPTQHGKLTPLLEDPHEGRVEGDLFRGYVGERMQDKATKLDPMNVWTLCTDQCCDASETCLANPVRGSWP